MEILCETVVGSEPFNTVSLTLLSLLVNKNVTESSKRAEVGMRVASQCTVNTLYPMMSNTKLVLEDNDTFNLGTVSKNDNQTMGF